MSSNTSMDALYNGVSFSSKAFSGVDPDAKHLSQGGYHVPRNKCPAGDYSTGGSGRNTSPRDRGGSGDISCAIDIRFSTADMITVTNRLIAAMGSNALRGVREFNGTADGRTTLNRDAVLGWKQNYTPDATHLWHIHIGFFRDTANDWRVINDVLSVINGVNTQTPAPTETIIEDDMATVPQNEWTQAKTDIAHAAQDANLALRQVADLNRVIQGAMGLRPLAPGTALFPGIKPATFTDTIVVGTELHTGQALWSNDGDTTLIVQTDGNIVLYDTYGRATWASTTNNVTKLALQTDGNLVGYTSDGKPAWNTGTRNANTAKAVLQTDGNFVLYTTDGKPVWSTLTRS